jgi:hypothetical protein
MNRRRSVLMCLTISACLSAVVLGAEQLVAPKFAKVPAAVKAGAPTAGSEQGKMKISFAVVEYSHGYLGVADWIAGAKWSHMGFGPLPATGGKNRPGGDPGCVCISGRFAVDPTGRIFMPNPFRFSVKILDASGNLLHRLGRYGNPDSSGPGSRVPSPEIAFASPFAVARRGDDLYVSDPANRRVVVIKTGSAASAECSIP